MKIYAKGEDFTTSITAFIDNKMYFLEGEVAERFIETTTMPCCAEMVHSGGNRSTWTA